MDLAVDRRCTVDITKGSVMQDRDVTASLAISTQPSFRNHVRGISQACEVLFVASYLGRGRDCL